MTSPIGIPLNKESKPLLDRQWLNIIFYVIASVCTALALVELPSFKPWVKALTAFGTMMFAVARWDKVLPGRRGGESPPQPPPA